MEVQTSKIFSTSDVGMIDNQTFRKTKTQKVKKQLSVKEKEKLWSIFENEKNVKNDKNGKNQMMSQGMVPRCLA